MRKVKSNAGETLVESLVSLFIFLMMVAILQGAISFSTNAQHKSEQIRADNAKICQGLQGVAAAGTDTKTLEFKSAPADGSEPDPSASTLFKVEVGLREKTVTYTDEAGDSRTCTFYVFSGTGGGAP